MIHNTYYCIMYFDKIKSTVQLTPVNLLITVHSTGRFRNFGWHWPQYNYCTDELTHSYIWGNDQVWLAIYSAITRSRLEILIQNFSTQSQNYKEKYPRFIRLVTQNWRGTYASRTRASRPPTQILQLNYFDIKKNRNDFCNCIDCINPSNRWAQSHNTVLDFSCYETQGDQVRCHNFGLARAASGGCVICGTNVVR